MKKTKKKGFTLVELIIVIAVIGVLAAILIPVFSNVIKKANSKSALADARNAVSQYVTESLERRLQSLIPIPEQIVLIVEKGGRYYIFGYDTSVTQSVQVSSVNEEGIPATGLQALINSLSWNAHHSENYDPNTTTTYSVETDGAFYLVPYTGTTPDNPNVRGFVTSTGVSGSFLRLDKEDEGYGFNLNLGNDTVAFHGCLVNGTYDTESSAPSNNGGSGGGSETASYSVNFTTTGIDDGDLGNIVYKKGGASLTNPATLTEGTGVGTLTAECPVATSAYSYTFTGATASNGHSTIDEAGMTITFAFTKVMAQTYNVTYNANGGSGTMTDNTDYLTNAVVTLPANTFTAPEHKHFTGWKINNTGELRAAGYQFNITADTEIYAQWADDTAYTVSFDANGGTGSMASIPSVYAGAYELPECAFTKTHYHFNGWLANNAGDPIFPHSNYDLSADVTFYATWEQDTTYTITYDGNGATSGTAPTDANSYYMNDTANLLGKGSLAYTHKHFTGWKVANGGALLAANSSYTVTGSVTMFAQWEDDATYTVTYNANGGTGTVTDSNTYYSGDTVTLKANTFTYTHKHFTGWLVNNTGDLKQAGDTFTITANATVYAQWENDATYTVTYDANAGTDTVTGMPSNQTGLYPGSHDLSSAAPERDGYTFLGWGATNNATTYITSVTITDSSVTVYAIWEQNAVSSNVYYYGGAYRHADLTLDWNATKLPEVSGNRPLNILDSLTLDTTLLNGTVVHRTFEETSQVSTIDGVDYIKCTETTDWSAVSGVTIVEQTAGATYSGSQSIVTILNTSSMRKNNTTNNSKNKQFVLIADMDLTSVAWKSSILSDTNDYFMGRFDGMGYTANGMSSVDETSKCNTSFFGLMTNVNSPVGAQNFNITNANISYTLSPKDYNIGLIASGLSGSSSNQAVIRNCHVSGNISMDIISAANKSFCGISNVTATVGVIENSSATVNISAYSKYSTDTTANVKVGGISAMCLGTIRNCRFKGTIMSNTHRGVGGIAGNAGTQTGITVNIQNCSSEGIISGLAGVGGIFGNNTVDSTINITNCHSTANVCCLGPNSKSASGYSLPVNGAMGAGGICGSVTTGKVIINKCWAKGDIYSDGGGVGGIVGVPSSTSRIMDCWSAGRVGARQLYTDAVGTNSVHVYVYNGIGGITGCGKVGDSGSVMAQDNIKRCVTYADVYAGGNLNNSKVFGYGYSSGNTSDAGYRMNTVKSATVNINTTTGVISISGGSTLTPADSTSTVCTVAADAATLKSSMQSAWTTTSAWNLTGTYPVLVDNPGSPS